MRIEIAKWGFVKRELHNASSVDFFSPVPCPFNYGYLLSEQGEDGDPVDAILLGPRVSVGSVHTSMAWGEVRFWDGGLPDKKIILGAAPPSSMDLFQLSVFLESIHTRRKP